MDNEKTKSRGARIVTLLLFLASLSAAGVVVFNAIEFLYMLQPNPTVIATNQLSGIPFYMCENGSISSTPCRFMTVQTAGNVTLGFLWSAGNGTVAKAELTSMTGIVQADLTNGANYSWMEYNTGTEYAIRITRLIPNSQMGNLTWSNVLHN